MRDHHHGFNSATFKNAVLRLLDSDLQISIFAVRRQMLLRGHSFALMFLGLLPGIPDPCNHRSYNTCQILDEHRARADSFCGNGMHTRKTFRDQRVVAVIDWRTQDAIASSNQVSVSQHAKLGRRARWEKRGQEMVAVLQHLIEQGNVALVQAIERSVVTKAALLRLQHNELYYQSDHRTRENRHSVQHARGLTRDLNINIRIPSRRLLMCMESRICVSCACHPPAVTRQTLPPSHTLAHQPGQCHGIHHFNNFAVTFPHHLPNCCVIDSRTRCRVHVVAYDIELRAHHLEHVVNSVVNALEELHRRSNEGKHFLSE
mmetsp:Transcript_21257/g.51392  ORF Transcript_21257/g.51392 Transcript_21257/m.51392 type:complete len:317 (+) Transcript_21257:78-1028(+)